MNKIEIFFLDFGLSWSISKMLPYVICVLLGLCFVLLFRRIAFRNRWLNRISSFILFVLPFSIYFALYPIYEGDFSNQGSKPSSRIQFPSSKTLTVIVLPDCPYCFQSISLIDKLISSFFCLLISCCKLKIFLLSLSIDLLNITLLIYNKKICNKYL